MVVAGQAKVDSLPKLKLYVKNLKGEKVYLRAYLEKGILLVDSLLIKTENDTLVLQGTEHDEELWYSVQIGIKYTFNSVLSKNHTAELFFDDKEDKVNFSAPDHYRNSLSSVDFNNILCNPPEFRTGLLTSIQIYNICSN